MALVDHPLVEHLMSMYHRFGLLAVIVLLIGSVLAATEAQAQQASVAPPQVVLNGIGFPVVLDVSGDTLGMDAYTVRGAGEAVPFLFKKSRKKKNEKKTN